MAKKHSLVDQYKGALMGKGVEVYDIPNNAVEDRERDGLRVATMHRVKGLEFNTMILAAINKRVIPREAKDENLSDAEVEEQILKDRALLYVAATRAKRHVVITSHGEMSEFLEVKLV